MSRFYSELLQNTPVFSLKKNYQSLKIISSIQALYFYFFLIHEFFSECANGEKLILIKCWKLLSPKISQAAVTS